MNFNKANKAIKLILIIEYVIVTANILRSNARSWWLRWSKQKREELKKSKHFKIKYISCFKFT